MAMTGDIGVDREVAGRYGEWHVEMDYRVVDNLARVARG
jgi:hypothetical protein